MILLTGGTGFLGTYLMEALRKAGEPVRVFCRNPKAIPYSHEPGVFEIAEGDILDFGDLEASMEGINRVIHAAGVVSYWKKRRGELREVNVRGTQNIVNLSMDFGIKKLVHVSSIAAFGRPEGGGVITEGAKWKESPVNSYYAKTKYWGELEVFRGVQEGLPSVIVNPGAILGPTQNWHSGTGRFWSLMHGNYSYYPIGSTGFVGASELSEAIITLLNSAFSQGEKFILVNKNLSMKEFLGLVAKSIGKRGPSKAASPKLALGLARWEEWKSFFSGKEPRFSREISRLFSEPFTFDGSKIEKLTPFRYHPFEEIIQETGKKFLQSLENQSQRKG